MENNQNNPTITQMPVTLPSAEQEPTPTSISNQHPSPVAPPATTVANESPIPQRKSPKRVLVVLLLVLVLSAIGVGVYLYFQSQKTTRYPVASTIPNAESVSPTTDPMADWKTYNDPQNTFSFKHPENVAVNSQDENKDYLNLYVKVKDLDDYQDEPLGYDLTNATSDKDSLENGQFGDSFGFSVPNSRKVITIDGKTGKSFIVLRMIDGCDLRFSKTVITYTDNFQIILTLTIPYAYDLAGKMPEYFIKDQENCGGQLIWNLEEKFVADLYEGKTPKETQGWNNLFDQILSTIKFTNETSDDDKIRDAISAATYSDLNESWQKPETVIDVKIDKVEGVFAAGSVRISINGEGPGNVWIAKKIYDVWTQIWAGQEPPQCTEIEAYFVPENISSCIK